MPSFEMQDLSFCYSRRSFFYFKNLSLSIPVHSSVGLLGANGAGKSTLLKLFAGLIRPSTGEVFWDGVPLRSIRSRERAKKIAFVTQSNFFYFPVRVQEIVEMGRYAHLGRFEMMGHKDREACEWALRACDGWDLRGRNWEELSGGEKQRVLLASALAQTPEALLLDEPTLSLDWSHQLQFFEIIRKLHRQEGLTILVATHEVNWVSRFLDRTIFLKKGTVLEDGPSMEVITPENIHRSQDLAVEKWMDHDGFPFFIPKKGVNVR